MIVVMGKSLHILAALSYLVSAPRQIQRHPEVGAPDLDPGVARYPVDLVERVWIQIQTYPKLLDPTGSG